MSTLMASSVTNKLAAQEFEQLFREHHGLVYRTAYSLLDNAADAEDVLQTLFLRLLRREFPQDWQKNIRGYFYRAAVNLSLDIIRARKRLELVAAAEEFEPLAHSSDADALERQHRRLTEAIAELGPEAAQIVILRHVHNYSDAEIAKLLGTSRGAIAVRLFRCRARLKELMREPAGDES